MAFLALGTTQGVLSLPLPRGPGSGSVLDLSASPWGSGLPHLNAGGVAVGCSCHGGLQLSGVTPDAARCHSAAFHLCPPRNPRTPAANEPGKAAGLAQDPGGWIADKWDLGTGWCRNHSPSPPNGKCWCSRVLRSLRSSADEHRQQSHWSPARTLPCPVAQLCLTLHSLDFTHDGALSLDLALHSPTGPLPADAATEPTHQGLRQQKRRVSRSWRLGVVKSRWLPDCAPLEVKGRTLPHLFQLPQPWALSLWLPRSTCSIFSWPSHLCVFLSSSLSLCIHISPFNKEEPQLGGIRTHHSDLTRITYVQTQLQIQSHSMVPGL